MILEVRQVKIWDRLRPVSQSHLDILLWQEDVTLDLAYDPFWSHLRDRYYGCWCRDPCISRSSETMLTHWGRVTHICVNKLTIIGADNGLSPGWRQAIIWTNDGILLIGPLGTNCSEILIEIYIFSFKKMHLKMSSGNWQPFCPGLNRYGG